MTMAIEVHGVSKEYFRGVRHGHTRISEALTQWWTRPRRPARDDGHVKDEVEPFWALKDVSFTIEQGRGRRHHRPQRRRQEHAAQDPCPDHRADDGRGPAATAASAACSKSAPASIPSSPAAKTSFSTAPSSA